MDLDRFTAVMLVTPEDPPELSEDEADRLQDAHLAHLAALHDRGVLLAAGPVYFIGTDPRFADAVRRAFAGTGRDANVRPVIAGRDDVSALPAGAPAYVMRTARERLGGVPPQLRALSTLRAFDAEARRAILRFIVRANLAAFASRALAVDPTHHGPAERQGPVA